MDDAGKLIAPRLCYACHTTLTSRSSRHTPRAAMGEGMHVPLPVWANAILFARGETTTSISERAVSEDDGRSEELWATRRLGADQMRDSIKDFLLDDQS
jgi:cytoplasmic tRNA 2-thiolation protein 2